MECQFKTACFPYVFCYLNMKKKNLENVFQTKWMFSHKIVPIFFFFAREAILKLMDELYVSLKKFLVYYFNNKFINFLVSTIYI